jgi:tight adherence protein B
VTALVAAMAVGSLLLCRPPSGRSASRRLRELGAADHPARGRRIPVPWMLGVPVLAGLVVAPGTSVAVGAGLAVAAVMTKKRRRAQLVASRRQASVDVVYALAAELRSGRPPAQALEAVAEAAGPLHAALLDAAAAARAGGDAAEELHIVAETPGCSALRGVAAAWRVTQEAGGPVADVLDRLGRALDASAERRLALEAALAAPRATAVLLAALPLLGITLGESVGAHPVTLLLHRPVGWALLAGAALLDAAGLVWVSRLAREPR